MTVLGNDPIDMYMTPMPHSIEPSQSLEDARKLMGKLEVRHLPVLSGGRIVGLLSERDLTYIRTLPGVEKQDLKVKDAMVYEPIMVDQRESLQEVSRRMADQHIGSVLVCNSQKKLLGIFSYIDALKVLGKM